MNIIDKTLKSDYLTRRQEITLRNYLEQLKHSRRKVKTISEVQKKLKEKIRKRNVAYSESGKSTILKSIIHLNYKLNKNKKEISSILSSMKYYKFEINSTVTVVSDFENK
jgi:ABC-type polar amino acid transport system ATPase subunit